MHQTEARALRQAVVLLVVLSAARWGWSHRRIAVAAGEGSIVSGLLSASREATVDEARRATPLAEGERIDPNRATEAELDRLVGIGPATARAIVATREGGTVFLRPEDLLAVRGIGPATVDKLRPFVSFSEPPRSVGRDRERPDPPTRGAIDPNLADLEALMSLPGIGPAIAGRIVAAREEQAFMSLGDLARVKGIGPATLERLRPHVSVRR